MTRQLIYQVDGFKFSYPFVKYPTQIDGVFDVFQGDKILLTGDSGCGKSSLLMALKGLIPNYIKGKLDGNIFYQDQPIQKLNHSQMLSIGYLQQNPDHQIVYQSVIDELAFALENLELSKSSIQQRIVEYSTLFRITHLLERKLSTLSGGEKQRINLMAILISQPKVILLDEPTAFLDPQSAQEIIDILKQHETNTTLIVVDHNQHYYQNFVNRIININKQQQFEEIKLATYAWQDNYPVYEKSNYSNKLLLQINQLNYNYPCSDKLLFKNLQLNLHQGEIAVISGKNGAGKSTLFKFISKLIKNDNIIFNNINLNKISKQTYWQEIGMLWQNPEQHFLHNSVEIELENNTDLMQQYNLTNQAKNNPYCLSEGQKRRLSLAIALLNSRKLFLLDEPTFGQDLRNKISLIEIIQSLAKSGHTFLIISHDKQFNQAIAHSEYLLQDGLLCQK